METYVEVFDVLPGLVCRVVVALPFDLVLDKLVVDSLVDDLLHRVCDDFTVGHFV